MRGGIISAIILLLVTPVFADTLVNRLSTTSSINPSSVYSGDNGYVTLELSNTGLSSVYDTEIKVTGSSSEVKLLTNNQTISVIDTGSKVSTILMFKVSDDAVKGVYYMDIEVSYTSGVKRTDKLRIAIEVVDSVSLYYSIDDNELLTGYNNVSVTIKNPSSRNVSNVFIKLIGNTPFSVVNNEIQIPLIKALSNTTINYTIWVDDVSEGIYPLILSREYLGRVLNATLNFRVHGKPDLTYDFADEFSVNSGSHGVIPLRIRNIGLATANNIKVSLLANDPFSIRNSEVYIPYIDSNSSIIVYFNYSIAYDAKPGIYSLNLGLDYETSETNIINIKINGLPDIEIAKISTDPEKVYSNSEFSISIQLENVGAGKAKNVKAFITPDYRNINGVTEYFIGSIQADDIDSAVFDLMLDNSIEGPLNLALVVNYTDQDNKEYSLSESVRVYVRRQVDYSIIVYASLIIVILLLVIFRKAIMQYIHKIKRMI